MKKDFFQNKKTTYDNLIMSWSCFGDFILISQGIKTLIESGQVKRGIIITHERSLKSLLSSGENIILLYPNSSLKDFVYLLNLSLERNIFILHDMPSYNKFSKQIRLIVSIILTLRYRSKLFLMIDKNFKSDITTRMSKVFASAYADFYIKTKKHISQLIIDMLYDAKIISEKSVCNYDIKLNETELDLKNIFKDESEYIVLHPFASNAGKSLTAEWCIESIKKINQAYPFLKILIIGGSADSNKIQAIISEVKNSYNMSVGYNFSQSLYVIKNSKLSISIPSGPAHFAAFYKEPQIVIWLENNTYSYIPTYNPNAVFIINNKVFDANNVYSENTDNKVFLPDTELVLSQIKNIFEKGKN